MKSGRLAVIPRLQPTGLAAKEREMPGQPAEHADLNRNFPKSGKPDQAETELGQSIWAFAKELRPDWVLDLHEGIAIHRQNPDSNASTILCRPDETTRPIFERALAAVNASIEDPDSHFMMKSRSKTANGRLARAAMERLGATSAILETTYSGIPLAVRIRQHRLMVNRILRDLGMVSAGSDDLVFRAEGDTETIWIAIYQDQGVGGNLA
ncbi:MAG: succinylglutamate desuccinylase/aspartoacylase family protein [Verrucomicrobiales bacterium]